MVALGRRGLSAGLLAIAGLVFYMVSLAAASSGAQTDGSGPPAGTQVTTENPDNPSSPPNLFTIPVADCTVANTSASVTLDDGDGTQGRVVDGQGVEITATANQIRIEILNDGDTFSDVAEFPDPNDEAFDTGGDDETVVTSTGITCADSGSTGQDQNNQVDEASQNDVSTPERTRRERRDRVMRNTIPRKPLPPTGGLPVYLMVSGTVLAGTGLVGLGLVIRRMQR